MLIVWWKKWKLADEFGGKEKIAKTLKIKTETLDNENESKTE